LVEVLAPFDAFDLAKVISKMDQGKAKEKMMSCLPRAKREEIESEMDSLKNTDPIEVIQIGQLIISNVKEKMLRRD
jgi:flagellar motor switch protein FliG